MQANVIFYKKEAFYNIQVTVPMDVVCDQDALMK